MCPRSCRRPEDVFCRWDPCWTSDWKWTVSLTRRTGSIPVTLSVSAGSGFYFFTRLEISMWDSQECLLRVRQLIITLRQRLIWSVLLCWRTIFLFAFLSGLSEVWSFSFSTKPFMSLNRRSQNFWTRAAVQELWLNIQYIWIYKYSNIWFQSGTREWDYESDQIFATDAFWSVPYKNRGSILQYSAQNQVR